MNDKTRAAEPLLVSGMRRHPTGDVRHVPHAPVGACGTSTAGFLRELDEWAAAVRAETLRQVRQILDDTTLAEAADQLYRLTAPPLPANGDPE